MLVAKADHVSFELVGDTRGNPSVKAPARHFLLHDEDGETWAKCSVLVGPCSRWTGPTPEMSKRARRYLGRDPRAMKLDVPPRAIGAWRSVGAVQRIYYVRRGTIMGGELFQHPFKGGRRRFFFWGPTQPHPTLWRFGDFYRLELPRGCIVNHRGFVVP